MIPGALVMFVAERSGSMPCKTSAAVGTTMFQQGTASLSRIKHCLPFFDTPGALPVPAATVAGRCCGAAASVPSAVAAAVQADGNISGHGEGLRGGAGLQSRELQHQKVRLIIAVLQDGR